MHTEMYAILLAAFLAYRDVCDSLGGLSASDLFALLR